MRIDPSENLCHAYTNKTLHSDWLIISTYYKYEFTAYTISVNNILVYYKAGYKEHSHGPSKGFILSTLIHIITYKLILNYIYVYISIILVYIISIYMYNISIN